ADVIINGNFATYTWRIGGTEYFGSQDFSLINSPSFTIDFDGTATVSDQSAPATVVGVVFETKLYLGEAIPEYGGGEEWGAGYEARPGNYTGNWSGSGGAQLSFELMIDI